MLSVTIPQVPMIRMVAPTDVRPPTALAIVVTNTLVRDAGAGSPQNPPSWFDTPHIATQG